MAYVSALLVFILTTKIGIQKGLRSLITLSKLHRTPGTLEILKGAEMHLK